MSTSVRLHRADQVGIIDAPPGLVRQRAAFAAGSISAEALREEEDRAVLAAIAVQRRAGLTLIGDGELRREGSAAHFAHAVEGCALADRVEEVAGGNGMTSRRTAFCMEVSGALHAHVRLAEADAAFLAANAGTDFKVTLPGPCRLAARTQAWGPGQTAYPGAAGLAADIARILTEEIEALAAQGVSCVQLNGSLAEYASPLHIIRLRQQGRHPERALASDIAVENLCHERASACGMRAATFLPCGPGPREGRPVDSFDWLAERLFDGLAADRFLLDCGPGGGRRFEPLRFLPAGKIAVLGLVDTDRSEIEDASDILRRIEAASRFCDISQLAVATRCAIRRARTGQAATAPDVLARKLDLVVHVAERVWGGAEAIGPHPLPVSMPA